jgi:putative ABC transport system permease protein
VSLWRELARGIRALTNRSAADQDVADEVQHYLEQATAAHVARGLSPEEALRTARIELGSVTAAREQVRGYGWENAVESLVADLRYAARRLRGAPGSTTIIVLTLAVGIGATTAVFSALNPILFRSLPYPDAGRITAILEATSDGSRNSGTFGMYRGLAERTRSFDALAVFKPWQPVMTGPAEPEQFEGQRVSWTYLRVLGVRPALGQDFRAADDRLHGPNVVILSEPLWRRRFGGTPAIIGRPITLDGESYVVIGVMPKDFENVLAPSAELWTPLQYDMSQGRAWGHHLRTIGRLRPGASLDEAARDVNAVGRGVLREQHPETYDPDTQFTAASLQDDLTGGVKPALLVMLGAVILVLLISCVNVTNLLIARGVQRRGEFALRTALGAGGHRLIRQLLTESLLLAALGGALGLAVAVLGVDALVALSPAGLPRLGAIRVDGAVLAFGVGITTLLGLAFGVVPALQAARADPHRELQQGSLRSAGGHQRTRNALVVAEVALALVLLVSSGLLFRSMGRLFAVDMGFDPSRLLTMRVQTSGHRLDTDSTRYRFFTQALGAVRQVPGVRAAAFTSQLPLSGDLDEYGALFDATAVQGAEAYSVFRYAVSPGYIELMRIPLREGRLLDDHDGPGAPPVALISESLARLRFPGESPLGRQVRLGGPASAPPYTIVGVVGDVRQMSLALSRSEAVYVTTTQWHFADVALSLVVRGRNDDAAALATAIRRAIWSVDKDQAIVRVATMDELLTVSTAERRFALTVFEAFALTALVLAAAGMYGVLSGSVAERTREIGVRSALGASRGRILALVVRQGLALTGLGVAIGLAGAALASRVIITMLFGVSPLDPVTYVGVIGLLGAVTVLACGVPAWRAARVDPATALRGE